MFTTDEKQEYYYLQNRNTKEFFAGFSKDHIGNPKWTLKLSDAKLYKEMTALVYQRRLELIKDVKIFLIEKL